MNTEPRRARSLAASPALWAWVALAVSLVMGGDGGGSRLWWLTPALFACFLGLWYTRRARPLVSHPVGAGVVVAAGGVLGAVAYELSLDAGGGFGGLHPDPVTSFLLLPGYAVPATGFVLWAIRRFRLDGHDVSFVAGVMSWYEALTVGGPAMTASPILAPLLVAFYVGSYAVYNGALGILLVDPGALWSPRSKPTGWWAKLALGVVGGAAAWGAYLLWAALIL